ncbi:MAG TPA: lysine-sensitive aspartokinase 3 [Candidatus Nanoarchaeia archaeon]|nr:lysine-sensitive aspartokinase 3 [Candidatus Nanoarchaeia archaeon]
MIITKFGGTSVGNAERIRKTAEIIKSKLDEKPVVVVSAVTKITDALIKLANESAAGKGDDVFDNIKNVHLNIVNQLNLDKSLLNKNFDELAELAKENQQNKKLDARALDYFQSFGERMSSKIVAAYLNQIGINSQAFNSWDLGLATTNDFGNAEPLESSYPNIKNNILKLKLIPVITGFIGKSENNRITTLGRGGSDYTAAIIGSAVDADEIQIWTDVNGVMTADPKIVPNAKPVRQVSFAEASELAYFGARVLHPKTILPAMGKNIPVRVLNSFNPKDEGTTIINKSAKTQKTIKSIACKSNTTLIHIESTRMLGAYGFLARIFYIFDKYRKSVDVISTSEVSVSLTVDNSENAGPILKELEEFAQVEIGKNKSIICVVGEGIKEEKGIAGRIFTALGKNNINVEMISQGASKINMTFIVDGKDAEKAVRALHDEYFG